MKTVIPFLMLALIFMTPSSHAENGGRGGGNAIVCSDSQGTTPRQILDYYEASLTTNLVLDIGPDTGHYQSQVNYVLDRLYKIDPLLAQKYRDQLATFEMEMGFVSADQLAAVSDSNEPVTPIPGCFKEQFAVQKFNVRPNEYRYLVNRDLWQVASSSIKAGLVLHELIYRDTVEAGSATSSDGTGNPINSDNARYLNAQFSSTRMASISQVDYLNLLKSVGMEKRKFLTYEDSLPILGETPVASQIQNPTLASDVPVPYHLNGKVWEITPHSPLQFSPDGKLVSAQVNAPISVEGNQIPVTGVMADFTNLDHVVISGITLQTYLYTYPDANGVYPTVVVQGVPFHNVTTILVYPDEQGNLMISSLVSDATLATSTVTIDGAVLNHVSGLTHNTHNDKAVWEVAVAASSEPQTLALRSHHFSFKSAAWVDFSADRKLKLLGFTLATTGPSPIPSVEVQVGSQTYYVYAFYIGKVLGRDSFTMQFPNPVQFDIQGIQNVFYGMDQVSFYEAGGLAAVDRTTNVRVKAGDQILDVNGYANFYPSGATACVRLGNANVLFKTGSLSYQMNANGQKDRTCFYENGFLKSGFFTGNAVLQIGSQSVTTSTGSSLVQFYLDGKLEALITYYNAATVSTKCHAAGLSADPTNFGAVFSEAGDACYIPTANVDLPPNLDEIAKILNGV